MKNKQKQIEEIVGDIAKVLSGVLVSEIVNLAYFLDEQGYCKIQENSVVLTREEYDDMFSFKTTRGGFYNILDTVRKVERKETAEKFAQALENRLDSIDTILHEDNEEVYLSANGVAELIDEIAKEITVGDK